MKYALLFLTLCWPVGAKEGFVTGECGPGTCGIPPLVGYKIPNGAACSMNGEVMPCWAMESPEANTAWYFMTHQPKPKKLTTKWIGTRVEYRDPHACDGWNPKWGGACLDDVRVELGLRSDGVVVWR